MRFPTVSRLVISASATIITAASAWAFVSSTASVERDPFSFGPLMAANAKVRAEQLQSFNASSPCSESVVGDRARMCRG
jgi:hypothetical protein